MDEFIRLLIKHLKTDIRNPWAWGSLVLSGAWLIAAGSIEHRFYVRFNEWQDVQWEKYMDWIKPIVFSPFLVMAVAVGAILIHAIWQTRKRMVLDPNDPKRKVTLPHDELLKIIEDAAQEAKRAGSQATIMLFLSSRSEELTSRLEEAYHHWQYANQKLIHPLDIQLNKIVTENCSGDDIQRLRDEHRDFMVLYAAHLSALQSEIPGFTSEIAQGDYPSNKEYLLVLNDLRDHTRKLKETAQRIWDSESPEGALFK